jgi:hypothetical protein
MTSLHRYRCRIGDPCRDGAAGIEKHCTESELGHAKPSPGFELCVGDVVRVARQRDGRVVRVIAPLLAPSDCASDCTCDCPSDCTCDCTCDCI